MKSAVALLMVLAPASAAAERRRRVEEVMDKVGIAHRAKHRPSQLSGGQQQRVAVARAVAGDPAILLADEPTAALDTENGAAVMDLLAGIAKKGDRAVLAVTHDPRTIRYADRVIEILDGRIVGDAPPGVSGAVSPVAGDHVVDLRTPRGKSRHEHAGRGRKRRH